MGFERHREWNVWQRHSNTREWNTKEFRTLEATSFSIFVDKLPIDVSKKELFHLFRWNGWINDIYLDRKVKEGNAYVFAFVRYTTKDGALKAIAEMDNMNLRGNKLSVKEAFHRGYNGYQMVRHNDRTNTTWRVVKEVKERVTDPAEELVMMIRCDDIGDENRFQISNEILDEWNFLCYNNNLSVCATKEKDLSLEQEMINNNKDEHQYSRNVLVHEVLKEWVKEDIQTEAKEGLEETQLGQHGAKEDEGTNKDNNSDVGQYEEEDVSIGNHALSPDLDETLIQIWEVCQRGKIKKKKRIIRERIQDKVTNEMERLRNKEVKEGEEALGKIVDNVDATEVVHAKEPDKTKCRDECVAHIDYEMGGYEDGQDLMAILKEQNEAIALKRRKTKQNEKARKSRSKKVKS